MRLRFGLNSIVFLGIVLGTLLLWIGFEAYHRKNDVNIPAKFISQASNPLPNSFDSETLKLLYVSGKDKFYEPTEDQPNTNQ